MAVSYRQKGQNEKSNDHLSSCTYFRVGESITQVNHAWCTSVKVLYLTVPSAVTGVCLLLGFPSPDRTCAVDWRLKSVIFCLFFNCLCFRLSQYLLTSQRYCQTFVYSRLPRAALTGFSGYMLSRPVPPPPFFSLSLSLFLSLSAPLSVIVSVCLSLSQET